MSKRLEHLEKLLALIGDGEDILDGYSHLFHKFFKRGFGLKEVKYCLRPPLVPQITIDPGN